MATATEEQKMRTSPKQNGEEVCRGMVKRVLWNPLVVIIL